MQGGGAIILIVEITSQCICICISKPQVAYLKNIQFHASVIPQQRWGEKRNRQGNMGCNKDGLRIQMNPEDIMLSEIGQSQKDKQRGSPPTWRPKSRQIHSNRKYWGCPGWEEVNTGIWCYSAQFQLEKMKKFWRQW